MSEDRSQAQGPGERSSGSTAGGAAGGGTAVGGVPTGAGEPAVGGAALGPPTQPAPAAAPLMPSGDWLGRLLQPAQESRNWLKFLGLVSLVIGGLSALTVIGLIVAWLYIWIGVLLWQAGDRAGWAHQRQDPFMLEQYISKLKTVIVILGVVTAIHVVMAVIAIGFFFTLGGVAALVNAFD